MNVVDNHLLPINFDIIHAKQKAFSILMEKKNFIHSVDHALRVHDNAMVIFIEAGDQSAEKMIALKLASYWHDTGKDDWLESEKIPHNIISAELFKRYAVEKDIPDNIVEMAESTILCHRNRGKDSCRRPSADEEKILWDADKLDMFNTLRVAEIVWLYVNGYEKGEFNLKETLVLWMSISHEFSDKFYFDVSRKIFHERFPLFKRLVKKFHSELSAGGYICGEN